MPIHKELDRILKRGVAEIIIEDEFRRLLESGKPLRLKEGFDPSHPDIHLGHVVGLRKLRQLQDLGHKVILIVGDWTAQIGDPSGQSQTRPMLTAGEVQANAETYMKQFFKVVDRERTEVRWQSEWFGKFDLADVIRLTSKFTVAQIMAREDFSSRQAAGRPIALTELLYPLLQAYDSVVIEADVEFGGIDQKFNFLMGRELQQTVGQHPQQVFMTPLLVGTDGRMKMSKSLGNCITVEDPPNEMFGRLMSVADHLIMDYFELITDVPDEELVGFRQQLASDSVNPMTLKKRLAWEIVCQFHGRQAAGEAAHRFEKEVQMKEQPDQIPEHVISFERLSEAATVSGLIYELKLAVSRGEAKRLISQGAIEVDGRRISSDMRIVPGDDLANGGGDGEELIFRHGGVIRVGKRRWARIFLKEELSNVRLA
ncbi:tyrosine--tRNA ligase [Dehalococcoidia bacterium]|nr:tyrosine--tRNA ligase [Dehalococcoidia bacterium]